MWSTGIRFGCKASQQQRSLHDDTQIEQAVISLFGKFLNDLMVLWSFYLEKSFILLKQKYLRTMTQQAA